MFCENCGKQIEDGSTFCEHCGAKCESAPAPAAAPEAATPATPKAPPAFLVKLKAAVAAINKKGKWILPVCGAALVAIIVAVILLVNGGNTVSMRDYLKIEVTGYEGYSQFYNYDNIHLDKDSLLLRALGCKDCKRYGDYEKIDENVLESYQSKAQNTPSAYTFYRSLDYEYTLPEGKNENNLCNGDVITITLTCDEAAAKQLGITIKGETFQYTVSGLKAAESFDLMQYLSVAYDGPEGFAYAHVLCNTTANVTVGDITFEFVKDMDYYTVRYDGDGGWTDTFWPYVVSDNSNLSNGDMLTINLGISNPERFIQYGVTLTASDKEITVDQLEELQEFDVLQYVDLIYDGVNESVFLSLGYTEDEVIYGDFRFDFESQDLYYKDQLVTYFYLYVNKSSWLSNGDELKISIHYDEEALARSGLKFKSNEMQITVSGMPEYAMHLSDLDGVMSRFQEASVDRITKLLYDDWDYAAHNNDWGDYSNQVIGDDLTLYKTILTTRKSNDDGEGNRLWLIYTITLDDNKLPGPTKYYFAVCQENIAYSSEHDILVDDISLYIYPGFTDYNEFYNDYITSYNLNVEATP